MNKYDRRKMDHAARKFCNITANALSEFSDFTESMKSAEEDKLENLPGSLKEGPQADNINESVEKLDSILALIAEMQVSFDEICDTAGVDTSYIISQPIAGVITDDGPRNIRFQILISKAIEKLLRVRAAQLGISCNELVCRALCSELMKDNKNVT